MAVYLIENGKFKLIGDVDINLLSQTEEYKNKQLVVSNVPLNTINDFKQQLQKQLLNLEKQRFQNVCEQYGYNGLADVQFYANQTTPDPEAQAILTFYSNANGNGYDDLVWDWITNTLPTYKTLKKLLSLDMKAIEEQIYQQATANNPLP